MALFAAFLLAGCGGDDDGTDDGAVSGSITVFAAASLTDAFERLGELFESANPGTDVDFNFAASSELVVQIAEGAPADVFASADEVNMQEVVDAGQNASAPVVFARNRLAIAVEPGNPEAITGLADLADPDLTLVLCAEQVPCGRYADQALAQAGVKVTPASRGDSVKATVSLVELGEADAAIVYRTDVASSDGVDGVDIPDDENVIATLPICALDETGSPDLARAWIAFVTSAGGKAVLSEEFGFLAP
jgi:molybdate transport system substrate-binding protein